MSRRRFSHIASLSLSDSNTEAMDDYAAKGEAAIVRSEKWRFRCVYSINTKTIQLYNEKKVQENGKCDLIYGRITLTWTTYTVGRVLHNVHDNNISIKRNLALDQLIDHLYDKKWYIKQSHFPRITHILQSTLKYWDNREIVPFAHYLCLLQWCLHYIRLTIFSVLIDFIRRV